MDEAILHEKLNAILANQKTIMQKLELLDKYNDGKKIIELRKRKK